MINKKIKYIHFCKNGKLLRLYKQIAVITIPHELCTILNEKTPFKKLNFSVS